MLNLQSGDLKSKHDKVEKVYLQRTETVRKRTNVWIESSEAQQRELKKWNKYNYMYTLEAMIVWMADKLTWLWLRRRNQNNGITND